jgi:hypothetical protein
VCVVVGGLVAVVVGIGVTVAVGVVVVAVADGCGEEETVKKGVVWVTTEERIDGGGMKAW